MSKPSPLFSPEYILRVCHRPTVTHVFGSLEIFEYYLRKLEAGEGFVLRVSYKDEEDRHIHETMLRQLGWNFSDKFYFSSSPAIPTKENEPFQSFWTFRPRHKLTVQVAA